MVWRGFFSVGGEGLEDSRAAASRAAVDPLSASNGKVWPGRRRHSLAGHRNSVSLRQLQLPRSSRSSMDWLASLTPKHFLGAAAFVAKDKAAAAADEK